MNVRDLEISLRPRRGWEASDLGFLLARKHYKDLFHIGLFGFAPCWLILIIVCWKVPFLAFFIIWLLKPLYDRFYLYYLSRRIFGQKITVKEVLKQAPQFLFKGALPLITIYRFSPHRSMLLPVRDLEGLKGSAIKERCSVIKREGGGTASMTTVALRLMEDFVVFALISTVIFFIESSDSMNSFYDAQEFYVNTFKSKWFQILLTLLPCFVFIVIEPFYAAAGFCLYLNSRSTQEAWDIELRFKEFAERLKKTILHTGTALSVAILVGLLALTPPMAHAEEPHPQDVVESVYEHEDFKIHTIEVPVSKKSEESKSSRNRTSSGAGAAPLAGFVNMLFYALAVVAVTALVALICYLIYKLVVNREANMPDATPRRKLPDTVLGMEISRESLPDNLLEAARKTWRDGHQKDALSLLYRAALSDIILGYHAEIDSSDTEYECQKAARKVLSNEKNTYFSSLTRTWITVAYSEVPVSDESFETLCQTWIFKQS